MSLRFQKNIQYYKFCLYGFLKNLRFFEPFLYLFFLEKGLTFLQIGILITTREISRIVLEIPTGILADVFGRRRTLILSFLSYIISFLVFYVAGSFAAFIMAMLLYSFGDAFRTGTHKAMIFEYLTLNNLDDQKVFYYGHTRSWSQIGSAISSLIAAFLVFYTGSFRFIFLYSVVPYMLDLLLIISYPKELDGSQTGFSGKLMQNKLKTVLKEIFRTFKNPSFHKPIVNISIFSGYFRALKDYLQPLLFTLVLLYPYESSLSKEKLSALIIGIVYFGIYILTSWASRKSGSVVERSGNLALVLNRTLLIGLICGILSGFMYTENFKLISILSIVFFLGIFIVENIRKPVGVSYIAGLTNKNILATTLSVESQVKGIFAAILAPLIGFFADKYGVSWGLVIVSLLLLILWPVVRLNLNYEGKETAKI